MAQGILCLKCHGKKTKIKSGDIIYYDTKADAVCLVRNAHPLFFGDDNKITIGQDSFANVLNLITICVGLRRKKVDILNGYLAFQFFK